MTIFSLQTKKHLVGWSLVFGFFINLILSYLTPDYKNLSYCTSDGICTTIYGKQLTNFGFPFNVDIQNAYGLLDFFVLEFWLNFIFWIIVSFVILSLIRHFKTRKI